MFVVDRMISKPIKKLEIPALNSIISDHDQRIEILEKQFADIKIPDTVNMVSVDDINNVIFDLQDNLQYLASTPRDITNMKVEIEELKQFLKDFELKDQIQEMTAQSMDIMEEKINDIPMKNINIPKLDLTQPKLRKITIAKKK